MKDLKTNVNSQTFTIPAQIDEATSGLPNEFRNILLKTRSQDNALTIANYILSMKHEINLSDTYRMSTIKNLAKLSNFENLPFSEITRNELLSFLDSHRKPEPMDPLHKWVGTYNQYLITSSRFFKWLYYPNLPQKERKKPEVIDNLKQLKRKETSIYKPTDLWTQEDDLLFLKYCPSKRDKCYHMMSRDTSCRPHEILGLRIKDVVFKLAGDRQYAEVLVNGKTGSRTVPLINSIPYLKDCIDSHPQRSNPNAYLMFGMGKAFGKKLSKAFYNCAYRNYKKKFFPKLLEDPKISPEDKLKIQELLKKPWNPYIRRHSALTEKSQILKENTLRQHAGWTTGSKMATKYVHYFGNESSESILEAFGLKPKFEEIDKMKPVFCPNCTEPNTIDSKFCVKCRMILKYDAYIDTLEQKEEQNEIIVDLASQLSSLKAELEPLITLKEVLLREGVLKEKLIQSD